MIKRKHYIEKIRGFYDSDLIKIITGIRRCGKSVVLNQIKEEIEQDGKSVLFLNFEDKRISSKIQNWNDLLNYVEENTDKDKKWYLFFDEIQSINGWQDAVKTLRLYNYSVFITGSNSKLLS
ncbi:MAG: AAA family ATPase, partial [Oscillospiraceae bacterium]|nr:AAA family ATPase [Oscillospiraceae bacterium]